MNPFQNLESHLPRQHYKASLQHEDCSKTLSLEQIQHCKYIFKIMQLQKALQQSL